MTLLDIVTESRELRDLAAKEYARAVVRASDAGHSLREIARAAGLASHNTVSFILKRERRHEEMTSTARFNAKHLARARADEVARIDREPVGIWLDSQGFIVSRMSEPVTRTDAALVYVAGHARYTKEKQ